MVSCSTPARSPPIRPISVRCPGRHHQPARGALGDQRARPQHRAPVAKRRIGGDRIHGLFHRHGLAGQDRLLRGQPPRLDHPQVGGHLVARLQQHDVAGHQVGPVHRHAPPVAQHGGARGEHAPDRRHRRLGLALLEEADHRIGQHHGQDHAGIDPVLQGPRHHGGAQQDIDQHVVELRQKPQQRPARPRLGQPVRPVFGQPPRGLGGGQAVGLGVERRKAGDGGTGVGIGQRYLQGYLSYRCCRQIGEACNVTAFPLISRSMARRTCDTALRTARRFIGDKRQSFGKK